MTEQDLRALLVDRNLERTSELEWAFLCTPFELRTCSDPEEACRRLAGPDAPHLLILAADLPEEGAERVLAAAAPPAQGGPWVLVLCDHADEQELTGFGAHACLPREASPPEVIAAAHRLVYERREEDSLVGRTVDGRYGVLRLIARGGMGAVYLARHVVLDEPVALKVIAGHLAGLPNARARFLREVRTNIRLAHPNVIAVRDCGLSPEGVLYLTMDYSPGRSLRQLLFENGPLEERRAIGLARQCALALGAAHAQGIVHRDLKPDNILIEADDVVRVCDFGLARFMRGLAPASKLTETGTVVGTPHYMAPEQAASGVSDERADLYSLGCVLYECMCGEPPFLAPTNSQIMLLHQDASPEPLSARGVRISKRLEGLILRLLAKNPSCRPDSAESLAEALAALLESRTEVRRLRVLLADDSPVGRRLLTAQLERRGHSVSSVADGDEAVALAAAPGASWDLILLDGEMPRMGGHEAARAIRSTTKGQRPVIALLSATVDQRWRDAARTIDTVLEKPIAPRALGALLEQVSVNARGPAAGALLDLEQLRDAVGADGLAGALELIVVRGSELAEQVKSAVERRDIPRALSVTRDLASLAGAHACVPLAICAQRLGDTARAGDPVEEALLELCATKERTLGAAADALAGLRA